MHMQEGRDNETKRLIRETATRLFQERSFEQVTLHDICRACGINKHTFYYYFASKDELLQRYYNVPWNLTAAETTEILTSDNYIEQVWLIVSKFLDHYSQIGAPIFRQILIKNLTSDVGTFRVKEETKDLFKLEVSIIKKGQDCGQFRNRSDPHVLAILIQQVLYSCGLMWAIFEEEFEAKKIARFLLENLLDVEDKRRIASEDGLRIFTKIFKDCHPAVDSISPEEENREPEEP